LNRATSAARLKSPSSPNGTSRSRKYRTASTQTSWAPPERAASSRATSTGSMTLPSDLLIFCPSTVRNPCTMTRRGGSSPAEISMAGHNSE
jgi:hypothetical protein